MRKHRFFCHTQIPLNSTLELDQEISHQIARVLRLEPTDVIYLFNNSGYEYTAQIESINKKSTTVKIISTTPDTQESKLKIHLAQVVGKGEKMDLVIQKATELGVSSITPLYSIRSVSKNIAAKTENKLEHWQRVAAAAACQCWRNLVPEINLSQDLAAWLNQPNNDQKIILAPDSNAQRIRDLKPQDNLTLLIGPEGGFDDVEIALALQHGFNKINLGPRILRTETAGIAAIAILQAMFGDI